jgi:hypothetical protein
MRRFYAHIQNKTVEFHNPIFTVEVNIEASYGFPVYTYNRECDSYHLMQ